MVEEGRAVLEACAEAQCVADCDVEPDADAPTCDAVRRAPPPGEPVPEADAEVVRVAPLAWIEAVAESCAGMEGDMEGAADVDAVHEVEGEGVAITSRTMVCAPLSATYTTFEMGSR